MAPSASFPASLAAPSSPALALKNPLIRPDEDGRPVRTPTGVAETPRTEELDAKWQSLIDAATD